MLYLIDFITKSATGLLMIRDIEGGAALYLTENVGLKQTGYRDWITGRIATDDEQAFLRIAHNVAVFVGSHVAFDQNDPPIRLTVAVFPVDRSQLVINVGSNVPPLTNEDRGR